jgi:hypothetical protein
MKFISSPSSWPGEILSAKKEKRKTQERKTNNEKQKPKNEKAKIQTRSRSKKA